MVQRIDVFKTMTVVLIIVYTIFVACLIVPIIGNAYKNIMLRATGVEEVQSLKTYVDNLKNLISPHMLILSILLAVPGIIIPLFASMWSSFLGSLFDMIRYVSGLEPPEKWAEVRKNVLELSHNSEKVSRSLRNMYIFSLSWVGLTFLILIASIFLVPIGNGTLSTLFLFLTYLFLIIFSIVFLAMVYYTLLTLQPFPKLSELIRVIGEKKLHEIRS